MPTKSRSLLFAIASVGALACTNNTSPSPSSSSNGTLPAGVTLDKVSATADPASPTAMAAAVTANNAFALSLYGQVASTSNANVITSPISASLALTMTYAGAKGATATEMASALQLPSDTSSIFQGESTLSQALAGRAAAAFAADKQLASQFQGTAPSSDDYVFNVVNSVWGEKTYTWATPFLDVLAQSYDTGVYVDDFIGDPTGVTNAINGWVSSATDDKINDLIPAGDISSNTRIVLVNAIHLKLPWQNPFDVSATTSGSFTRGDGTQVTASFMNQGLEAAYVETAQAQVVSLPLSDSQLSVVFALPKNGIASLVSSLTPETWAAMTSGGVAEVALSLPKFTFTSSSFSLVPALQALGMKTAFTSAADFTGLCANPPDGDKLFISDVLQKATITVAENGVEAAAATAVIGAGLAAPVNQVKLTIDQPFLVSIVDSSGAIVFLGQVNDPTSTSAQ